MASVVNFANRNLISRLLLSTHKPICCRWVTTGKKNRNNLVETTDDKTKLNQIPDFSKPSESKNWVTYGFDFENAEQDKYKMHSTFFFAFLALVWSAFFLAYMPDYNHKNWARREAFIRLYEREKLGLDPIDMNYVDPKKVILPSDEELGDFEIII